MATSSKHIGAQGLQVSVFLPFRVCSLAELSVVGNANKDLLPKARGPNSALPAITGTILPSDKLFAID